MRVLTMKESIVCPGYQRKDLQDELLKIFYHCSGVAIPEIKVKTYSIYLCILNNHELHQNYQNI